LKTLPLHLAGNVDHFIERKGVIRPEKADDIDFFARRARLEDFSRHETITPRVDDLVVCYNPRHDADDCSCRCPWTSPLHRGP